MSYWAGVGQNCIGGDSQQLLIQLVQKRSDTHHDMGVIVADNLRRLDNFQEANTSFVRRMAMGLLKSCQRSFLKSKKDRCSTWEFMPPVCLLSILHGDGYLL
ncbi:hypothetical protein RHMOL_Rhmol08G0127800 [Rhododendron molle]|nr:hypothetical protein RHMOL_Rhmol08G0127800 [Rhododendron molle]